VYVNDPVKGAIVSVAPMCLIVRRKHIIPIVHEHVSQ